MKNIFTRALTGAAYVAIIVAGILCGQVPFMALGCLLAGLGVAEFSRLANAQNREHALTLFIDIVGALILVIGFDSVFFYFNSAFLKIYAGAYILYLIVRLTVQLYNYEKAPLSNLAYSFMGQLYVALPIALMAVIRSFPQGKWLLLAMFVMIWLNDTGAFLVGCSIGRHRLFERISPKKSWEGFFGGVLFAIASAFLFRYAFPGVYASRPLWNYIVMGAVVAVFSTWGDLVESLIKRTLDVKDSGKLLPGHGGILDRIDSLLLVSPAILFLLLVL